ncbi:GNAT family N-acetyltransferase [Candidatus Jordarchaeum sp.]|uniref:GNAT family N-acetyltransferase n=1 Tax=Candidatus Jordarchaeum sp. TaxID=2823881 RepID=UPI004049901C
MIFVKKDNTVLGLLPLMFRNEKRKNIFPYRRIKFLASENTDFNIVLADPMDVEEVTTAGLNWLCSGALRWELLILDDLVEGNPIIRAIPKWAERSHVVLNPIIGKYYYINLQRPWDDIWGETSKKFIRKNINVARNRLDRSGCWQILVNPFWETKEIADQAIKISSLRGFGAGISSLRREAYKKFLTDVIDINRRKGIFNSYWMILNGTVIAYEFIFEQREVCYAWTGTFNPEYARYWPSRLLLLEIMKRYHEKRFKEFSFMRGEAEYKAKWTPNYKKNYRFIIKNKNDFYGKMIISMEKLYKFLNRTYLPTSSIKR